MKSVRKHLNSSKAIIFFSVGNHRAVKLALSQAKHVGVHSSIVLTSSFEDCSSFKNTPCVYDALEAAPTSRHQMLRLRVRALNKFYNGGFDVFQLDTDVILYKNPLEQVAMHDTAGLVVASDGKLANAGVVFAQHVSESSDRVISGLLNEWEQRMYGIGGDEQGLLHDLLANRILNTHIFTEWMTNRTLKYAARDERDRKIWRLNTCNFNVRCFTLHDGPSQTRMVALSYNFSYGQDLRRRFCEHELPVLVHLSGYPSKFLRPLIIEASHKFMTGRYKRIPVVKLHKARKKYWQQLNNSRINSPIVVESDRSTPLQDLYPIGCTGGKLMSLFIPYTSHGYNAAITKKLST